MTPTWIDAIVILIMYATWFDLYYIPKWENDKQLMLPYEDNILIVYIV